MSDRTYKVQDDPMHGPDVREWQAEVRRLFEHMGIRYDLDADGYYGQDTRDATESLVKAAGLLPDAMSQGVTPALRTKLRHRPDGYTPAEVKRFESADLVGYRRKLRDRAGDHPGTFPGSPIPGQKPQKATHQTDGLPGYPAVDYFAPAGSPCVSPVTGKVTKLSGHDPAGGPVSGPHGPFGWSVYVEGDGKSYFLTHMGSRTVTVGSRVQQGQRIGTVGDYARWGGSNHIHQGVHQE